MEKEKDEEYRKSYTKTLIYKTHYNTNTLKRFKISVSELNMNRKIKK